MSQKLKFFIAFSLMMALSVALGIAAHYSHSPVGWIACGYMLHEAKGWLVEFFSV